MGKSKKTESPDTPQMEEQVPRSGETTPVAEAPKKGVAAVPNAAAFANDWNRALNELRTTANRLERNVRDNPMAAVAIAAAVGLSIGLLVNARQH